MHANAKYVSEGALGYINGEEFYKEVRDGKIVDFLKMMRSGYHVLAPVKDLAKDEI